MTDIVLSKKESVERCVRQIRSYYQGRHDDIPFETNYLLQDAIAMNLQRACEQCIDLANHAVKEKKLGLPRESRDGFRLLAERGIVPRELAGRLERMVGFRNILVHEYQQVQIAVMRDIVEHHLADLLAFTDHVLAAFFPGVDRPSSPS